jgi:hypothetical protein
MKNIMINEKKMFFPRFPLNKNEKTKGKLEEANC